MSAQEIVQQTTALVKAIEDALKNFHENTREMQEQIRREMEAKKAGQS